MRSTAATVTRTIAGALPSAESGPYTGDTTSITSRYSPGRTGVSSANRTTSPSGVRTSSGDSSADAGGGSGTSVVDAHIATRCAGHLFTSPTTSSSQGCAPTSRTRTDTSAGIPATMKRLAGAP